MRIISGNKKGSLLYGPDSDNIRPTTDRAKEALFNIINFDVIDSTFLDLFTGSGQVALEAKSRGALDVLAVDKSQESKELVYKNILKTKLDITFILEDVKSFISHTNKKFDIIFMDPPFFIEDEIILELIDIILEKKLLNVNGKLIIERKYRKENAIIYSKFENVNIRKYGKVSFIFIK